MLLTRLMRPAIAGGLLLFGAAGATAQRDAAPNALNGIERGQWQLKAGDGGVRQMCVRNPAALLQIMHGDAQCEHFVMESNPRGGTIRYTCPSRGHGRTSVSIATPRAINIETQGVANGAPFSERFEGRRTGACN